MNKNIPDAGKQFTVSIEVDTTRLGIAEVADTGFGELRIVLLVFKLSLSVKLEETTYGANHTFVGPLGCRSKCHASVTKTHSSGAIARRKQRLRQGM